MNEIEGRGGKEEILGVLSPLCVGCVCVCVQEMSYDHDIDEWATITTNTTRTHIHTKTQEYHKSSGSFTMHQV